MSNFKKLSHVNYRCMFLLLRTTKYRYRVLEGLVKELLSKDIETLLEWKSSELIDMNVQRDHICLIVSVLLKLQISKLMGILQGKTAINILKLFSVKRKAILGQSFFIEGILR